MYKSDLFGTKKIIDRFDSLKLSLNEKKQKVFFKEQELDMNTIPKNFSQIPMNKIENSLNLLDYDPENSNFFGNGKFNEYVIQLSGEKLFYLPNEWDYKSLGDKKMGYVCLKDSYIPLKIRKFDSVWKYVEY